MDKRIYAAGKQGFRVVINMPKEAIGKEFTRSTWKDGKIVYTPVEKTQEGEL